MEELAVQVGEATLALRRAFSMFPTGVVAMCGMDGATPVGMAVNSFSSVSLDPPLVSVCVARQSGTWPRLNRLPRIGLSVLGVNQERLSRQLSSRHGDRFEGVEFEATSDGALFVKGAALWLDCAISDRLEGGDHEIILLEVRETSLFPHIPPLVFHQSQYLALSNAS
ncbi:oxidoreductase [Devosia insulae DS-56]|uniref:Oxidoreductase n=1 Tax=Devosia insulae DS-56 TaxID=1116389 RepID=A0A1E5XU31_9HYPH|nr:oxidoreductase [Devosia insulae DS-56]